MEEDCNMEFIGDLDKTNSHKVMLGEEARLEWICKDEVVR